ncbi:MAG: hexokinase [Clostridiales bacterium]|nr:hexokinase [Clostridiales bacterium]
MDVVSRVGAFLHRYGMHPDCIDFEECKKAFISDMKAGLEGKASSLLMIPSYLSADGCPREGDTAVAVDIGGTNLRIALTQVHCGAIEILEADESPVPGMQNEITKEMFLCEIADRLRPVINRSRRIGVCFSHAAEILPDRDGRLLSFSKEIRVTGAEGMKIGKELSRTLQARGIRGQKSYVVLNDTTAVLLGGVAAWVGQAFGGCIGFVLGTGKNLCYAEKTPEIKKLSGGYPGEAMIVNTESGYFTGVPTGEIDRELDSQTANPGTHTLEKMTSGRYLSQLILLTLKKAAADGLLSDDARRYVQALEKMPLSDISDFLSDIHGGSPLSRLLPQEDDRAVLSYIAGRLIERSAKLSAMSVAAVMEKTDAGRSPDKPVVIVAEGSTFHRLFSFREKFGEYMRLYINEKLKRYCRVEKVGNATLLGSSFAALIN